MTHLWYATVCLLLPQKSEYEVCAPALINLNPEPLNPEPLNPKP